MTSLLSPLFSILNWIICLVVGFFYLVADGILWAVNIVIAGVAAALVAILVLLPAMPSLPSLPTQFTTAEGWIAWFWPVSTTVDIIAFIVTAWLVWLAVAMMLRWARAIGS